MSKPSAIGKNHVVQVGRALKQALMEESIEAFPETIVQTVHFILKEYPNIERVVSKYDTARPDHSPDLQFHFHQGKPINVNLFTVRGGSAIQPKNLGAKSFLKKYFHSNGLQLYFNDYMEEEYTSFLKAIISPHEEPGVYDGVATLRRKVNDYYPKFNEKINPLRTKFLFKLREYCFDLLKDEYNLGAKGIQSAFEELMMLKETTIITRYTSGQKCLRVERWKSEIDSREGIQLYKKGNDAVGIRSGNEALTIRFKFESRPTSSIKLATSYEVFPEEREVVQQNMQSIQQFEDLIHNHVENTDKRGKSNAIGKCNEAMIYYRLVKENPTVNQVDEKDYLQMLEAYYSVLSLKELTSIETSSTITTERIYEYLVDKYEAFEIVAIQLVGESYLANRLDTSDLQMVLVVDQKYVIESLSLKAIAKKSTQITAKNPGAGQLLGPTYFDIGSLALVIDEVEAKFKKDLLNHRQSLESVSKAIGEALQDAPQTKLKKGVKSLLGDKTTVVTIYFENDSIVLAYDDIQDEIEVLPQIPSSIQTTLLWNEQQEKLSLRVKFSRGQKYGWSALKLAVDYRLSW